MVGEPSSIQLAPFLITDFELASTKSRRTFGRNMAASLKTPSARIALGLWPLTSRMRALRHDNGTRIPPIPFFYSKVE